MNKCHIIHLRASNFYGGPERQLHFYARSTDAAQYDITITSFTESGARPEFLEVIARDGFGTHAFEAANAYDPRAVRAVRRFLREKQVNILCTHDYRTHLVGWLASRFTDVSWVAFSRGFTAENWKVRLFHLIEKGLIRFADRIIAVSESQKEKLAHLGISRDLISVIHNAIDIGALNDIKPENHRARFNFPPQSIVCVTAGRFSPEKGNTYLVRAAKIASASNSDLRFVLFGDGPELTATRLLIERLNLRDKVVCPGHEKNILPCLKGADILVNPSLSEGLPNVVLEALALGLPVIATSVGGVPEIITDGVDGFLVEPGSADLLAQKILAVAGDLEAAATIAENGLRVVRDKFSIARQGIKLAEILSSLAGSGDQA